MNSRAFQKDTWTPLVLEDQQRDYAQYFLRKSYPRSLTLGLLGMILISLILYGGIFGGKPETAAPLKPQIPKCILELPPPDPHSQDFVEIKPGPDKPEPKTKSVLPILKEPIALEPDIHILGSEEVEIEIPSFELTEEDWIGLEEAEIPEIDLIPNPLNQFPVDEEPLPLNMMEVRRNIGYPQILRDAGVMGSMKVRVFIGKDGNYIRHEMIQSMHPIMDRQLDRCMPDLKCKPAIKDGKPVAYWITIPFYFCVIN